jgi:methylglutaconyl-CoA hydratase
MSVLIIAEQNDILTITLNRPELRNAFNPEMISGLKSAFSEAAKKSHLRAIVLRGAGTSFCAGADLNWMKDMINYSLEQNRSDSMELFAMFDEMSACPVPVIGFVHGHVMGGALGLLSCCDVVVAEKATQMAFSEVRVGLAPAVISGFVLRSWPGNLVKELMLTGRSFTAEEAHRLGLIQYIGDASEAEKYLQTVITYFQQAAPEAVRTTKRLIQSVPKLDWHRVKEVTTQAIAERRVSAEGQEGLRGFLEKRSPSWKKK